MEIHNQPILLSADAILPMDPAAPPLLHNAGIILENGTITAVAELPELRRRYGSLPHEHHPGTLLPGFINAHTHLELSYQTAASLAGRAFPEWVAALIRSYPRPEQLENTVRTAIQTGVQKSLAAGVATVGDISRHIQVSRPVLAQTPIRAVSFGEIVALGTTRNRLEERLQNAANTSTNTPLFTTALSPHAPYTIEGPVLEKIVQHAIAHHLPICMHLAELAEEAAFLRDLSGPLGRNWDLMQKMNILDEHIPTCPDGPIHWAHNHGLLDASTKIPVLLAHANYCNDAELNLLANSKVSIAYCPRTHAYFRHPPHRYRDMLAAGINICLATDSLASNPDLNPLKEAALLHQRDQLDPLTALQMITKNAAQALGTNNGTLAPGRIADILLLPIHPTPNERADQLASKILNILLAPTDVWINGNRAI